MLARLLAGIRLPDEAGRRPQRRGSVRQPYRVDDSSGTTPPGQSLAADSGTGTVVRTGQVCPRISQSSVRRTVRCSGSPDTVR